MLKSKYLRLTLAVALGIYTYSKNEPIPEGEEGKKLTN